jgi:hypothetical protein
MKRKVTDSLDEIGTESDRERHGSRRLEKHKEPFQESTRIMYVEISEG